MTQEEAQRVIEMELELQHMGSNMVFMVGTFLNGLGRAIHRDMSTWQAMQSDKGLKPLKTKNEIVRSAKMSARSRKLMRQ